MRFLPADLTPLSPLLKKVDQWTQPEKGFFKKHMLSRAVTVVATPPLALISSLYNAFAFTVKAPVVLVRYTVLLIPIKKDGKWRTVGSLLPDSLGFKELAKHAAKIFAYVIDIFFAPILGFISPRANIWVHEKLGLMTPRNQVKQNPYLDMEGVPKESTPLLVPVDVPSVVQPRIEPGQSQAAQPQLEQPQALPQTEQPQVQPVVEEPILEQLPVNQGGQAEQVLPNPIDEQPAPIVNPPKPPPPPPPQPKQSPVAKNPLADALRQRRRGLVEEDRRSVYQIAEENPIVEQPVAPIRIVPNAQRNALNEQINNGGFIFRNHVNPVERNGVNINPINQQAVALAGAIPVGLPAAPVRAPSIPLRDEAEWA